MKKVCLIAPGLLPVPASKGGAIETLLTSLIRENERQRLLDLSVVTTFDDKAQEMAADIQHTRFIEIPADTALQKMIFRIRHAIARRMHGEHDILPSPYYVKVLRALKGRSFDEVILEGGPASAPRLFARRFPSGLWYHMHYVPEWDFDSTGYTKILAVSDFAADAWRRHCRNHEAQIETVHNGIDDKRFSQGFSDQERNEARRELGFSPEDVVVLYCGRIIPVKGVLQLLKAVERIDDPHVKLLIIGSPNFGTEERTEYLDEVERSVQALADRVKFTGFVQNSQLWRYAKLADMQAVPSLWEDAAPTVCMEAMAMGLPLIVTRSGGIQEYTSPECALTVPKDDHVEDGLRQAIIALRDDPRRRRCMSQAGLKRARDFTVASMYAHFVEACERS
ncbi:glycosyltransferase family 4 protein [Bifidobacterium vansinderenii]|uniref:Glycosyltransferase, group 1 family protein n=1 Tax=Bifidobacterium vansinderenii TaxID=1984871 RepID=A0A229VZX9_9BIFI|nr:glycosyltransferase family 4 protein [Bifidobacterium vansinderenii]OXN01189.1 glycosyltransferase, group 1 family protein [Bifidobacterium vansinderenii]